MRLLLREMADLGRYAWKTAKAEKAITLYVEHEGHYPCFEGLIKELNGEYNQTLCCITSNAKDPLLGTRDSRVKTFYLRTLLPYFMGLASCRVLVMTLTDLNQLHVKRSINPVRYVYVFHALVSTHMMYRYGSFDHYDCILCVGPHQVKEIRRHEEINGLRPKQLVEAGYGRLELIYEAYLEYSSRRTSSPSQKTVLIAPSWGAANVLESCGERLVELLLETGHKVIVRPHPETVKRSPSLLASIASRFGGKSDFDLEMSVATHDSLLRADVLICDCSGVALEYAFGTERPVLFLDVPVKIRNPRYQELGMEPLELSLRSKIGVIVPVKELDTVPRVISSLMANAETYKARIVKLREENVYCFGHSSEVGARCIMDLARQPNQGSLPPGDQVGKTVHHT